MFTRMSCVALILWPSFAFAGTFRSDCLLLQQAAKEYGVSKTRFNISNRHYKDGIKAEVILGPKDVAWSGHWYPYKQGGIATRWHSGENGKYVPFFREAGWGQNPHKARSDRKTAGNVR